MFGPLSHPRHLLSRLPPAARWLGPSIVAACAGALVTGGVEGAAATGFIALIAAPALLVLAAAVRGLTAAWQPRAVLAQLTDDDGGAPRLAGWLLVIGLGALGLAVAVFHGVWRLALSTAFKPLVVGFAMPVIAVAAVLAVLALSRPAARLLTWLARRLDARWRRRANRRSLFRPRVLVATAAILTIAAVAIAWELVVKPQLGPLDTSPAYGPAAGVIVALAVHLAWPRVPAGRARAAAALAVVAATVLALAAALLTPFARPALALEVWGDRPLAGLAIENLFNLDAIRDRLPFTAFRPAPRPGAAHPDIVLVTIDTVRADHTPPYGGQADMPALRDLAARGATFEWAFAPSNVTRRSIPSMVIGLAPTRVRGRVVGWALRVDPRHVLLAERLLAGGYDTAGFMCCEGFWGKEFHTGLERGLAHLEIDPHGHAANAWLTAREQRGADQPPLFVWMHIIEPHNWTQGNGDPHNDGERRRLYDRSLTSSDQMLQQLLAPFHNRPPDRAPIVIVTADHGEALGEHGQPYHSTDLYDSQIHVPLVIAGPGIKPARVPETASLTDLVPTVLDLAGFEPPAGAAIDGRSLADLATGVRIGSPDAGAAFAAMIQDRSNPGGMIAVVLGRWKLIKNHGEFELYDTRADPDEHTNVIQAQPREAAALRRALEARITAVATSPFHEPTSP
jgi:arylsulfatase A-like enzyme